MYRYFTIFVLLSSLAFSQYQVKSPYLQYPEKMIPYTDSCAQLWLKAYDPVNGGFWTNVDRQGNLITSWGTYKNTLSQSRDAYGFTRAFMLTGNDIYLQKARQALDFLYQHCWDNTNGGWYIEIDRYGNPTANNNTKNAFNQHYALLGILASFEATNDSTDLAWFNKGFAVSESKLWDSRVDYPGYYDNVSANWATKTGKTFNSTVDALTTHTLLMPQLGLNVGDRLYLLTANILGKLVPTMDAQAIGFAESFDSNWNIDNGNTTTIMGHVLKTAWCLGRLYKIQPVQAYIAPAKKLISSVWQKGYDHQYGGPYKDFNRTNGVMFMYNNPDTAKAWWQMEQAITAGLIWYDITKDQTYLQMADETLDFYMAYFVDHVYGDVYENRARKGPLTWGDHKGNGFKAAYHSIETGYYTYLYGSLFYKQQPVSLYYNFAPKNVQRNIAMNTLDDFTKAYKIQSVTLNGVAFTNFDPISRVLNINPGVGGKFKVTYEPTATTDIAQESKVAPANFVLSQNFPNPVSISNYSSTTISYRLPKSSSVSLKVYDMMGKEIAVLENSYKSAGDYHHVFNASQYGISSGIYIYRLTTEESTASRKMIVIK